MSQKIIKIAVKAATPRTVHKRMNFLNSGVTPLDAVKSFDSSYSLYCIRSTGIQQIPIKKNNPITQKNQGELKE